MKKVTKLFALLLAILMMCLCLCGCDELDELRNTRATWTKPNNFTSFEYDGNTYKLLDANAQDINPLYNSSNYIMIEVTKAEVPLLLTSVFCDYLDISDNKIFVHGYIYDEYYVESKAGYTGMEKEVLYCRADMYDEINKKLEDGIEYTKYGYGYWEYDEEDADSSELYEYMDDEYHYYYLTKKEIDTINEIISSSEAIIDSEIPYEDYYIVTLDAISEDEYFAKESYEIYTDGLDNYSLNAYDYHTDTYKTYIVDKKYIDIMDKIVANIDTEYMFYE